MTHVLDALGRIKEYWGSVALADLDDYAQGRIIRGGAVAFEAYAAETLGAVLIGDGTDVISDTTPIFGGEVSGDTFAVPAKNTSGGAVTANSVGYLDEAGEFKLSSVDYEDVNWCVVVEGGANNADIYVARRGRVTVELNANCAVGDFLYMANVGGNQQRARTETYMRPEMFAIARTANVGGAGGTCSALLHCERVYLPVAPANNLLFVTASAPSDFRATISAVGANTVDYNAPISGSGNAIDPVAATELGKIRLYNETDADYALIDDVNTGISRITLVGATPPGWAIGETITARSQICVIVDPAQYFDVDLSSADNTDIPELAVAILLDWVFTDTGAAGIFGFLHPWMAYIASRGSTISNSVAGVFIYREAVVQLINQRFCVRWGASGAATQTTLLRIMGYFAAAP